MKLGILSDLHLRGALDVDVAAADVVILAGDISRPREAVEWALGLEKPVLYIAGNHEFYGNSITGTLETLRRLCDGTPIRFLDNDEVVIDGVRFLGSTLWTDFLLFGAGDARDTAMREGQRFIRDFAVIRNDDGSGGPFTPEDSATLFARNAQWLARKLAAVHAGPTVVITHHAPSRKSIHPRFADSNLNACFISDAEYLLDGQRAQLWIHGHTHDSFDYDVNGTRVLCNPRGYVKDGVIENVNFNPALVVEVAG